MATHGLSVGQCSIMRVYHRNIRYLQAVIASKSISATSRDSIAVFLFLAFGPGNNFQGTWICMPVFGFETFRIATEA